MIKTILITTALLMAGTPMNSVASLKTMFHKKAHAKNYTEYRARITYYTVGEDKWGSRVADPNTHRAKHGITIAHHKSIPFGTVVEIPKLKGIVGDGMFKVQDRGGAINSKKASRGKTYVIDVFVKNKRTMRKLMHSQPMYMSVRIYSNEAK